MFVSRFQSICVHISFQQQQKVSPPFQVTLHLAYREKECGSMTYVQCHVHVCIMLCVKVDHMHASLLPLYIKKYVKLNTDRGWSGLEAVCHFT